MQERIPIFFTFDNNYAAQCGVTFESLLYNAHKSVFYELYILSDFISEENQNKLHQIVNKYNNATLEIIILNENKISFHNNFSRQISDTVLTKEALYRCVPTMVEAFDKYDKIIYSDVDIVVMKDISQLYDIDLEDKYLASFKTPAFLSHETEHLEHSIRDQYFGGGLWIMNLKKMREDNLEEKILSITNNQELKLIWNEQDIMNIACDGNVAYFSYEYVSLPHWYYELKDKDYYDEIYKNRELEDAMMRPAIIHYAGYKPWVKRSRPPRTYEIWYYYLRKTPFKHDFDDIYEYIESKIYRYKIILFGFIPLGTVKIEGAIKGKIYIKIFNKIKFIKLTQIN